MNQIFSKSHGSERSQRAPRQMLIDLGVGFAMALVAIAITVALNLHFGLGMSRSMIAGVMFFALLIGGHFMIVPREPVETEVSALEDEELWRTLKEQRRMAPGEDRMAMATRTPAAHDDEATPDAADAAAMESAADAHVPSRTARIQPADGLAEEGVPEEITSTPANTDAAIANAPQPHPEVAGDGERGQSEDYWSFRPRDAALGGPESPTNTPTQSEPLSADAGLAQTPAVDHPHTDLRGPIHDDGLTAESATSPRESDVELVQSMIKKLAHQVNASEALAPSASPVREAANTPPPPVPQSDGVDRPAAARPPAIAPAAPPLPPGAPSQVDMVGETVEALRNTADALRMADAASPDRAPNVEQPLRPAKHPEGDRRGQAVTTPLATGQYGVMLEPILELDGLQPYHYEVHLKLNTPAQAFLDSETVEKDLQATDALPVVDQHRFAKAFNVAELLHARGKATDVLTRVYRESLLNRDYCYAVASNGVGNETLAQHIVLSFTQDAIRSLTAVEWQTLSDFREVGYRFAICDVTDIDMDFFQLTALGFEFVKLDAQLFLNGGSREAEATLTSQELARYFAGVGLKTVLQGVDSAGLAGKLAQSGGELVQGQISGGPRLMRADVVRGATDAVA